MNDNQAQLAAPPSMWETRIRGALLFVVQAAGAYAFYQYDQTYDGLLGSLVLLALTVGCAFGAIVSLINLVGEHAERDFHFIINWRKEWVYLGTILAVAVGAYKALPLLRGTGSDFHHGAFLAVICMAAILVAGKDITSYVQKRRAMAQRLYERSKQASRQFMQ